MLPPVDKRSGSHVQTYGPLPINEASEIRNLRFSKQGIHLQTSEVYLKQVVNAMIDDLQAFNMVG